jgi:hypothetical protein
MDVSDTIFPPDLHPPATDGSDAALSPKDPGLPAMGVSDAIPPPNDSGPSVMEVSDPIPPAMGVSDAIPPLNDSGPSEMEVSEPVLPPRNLSAPTVGFPPTKKRKLSPVQRFDHPAADE